MAVVSGGSSLAHQAATTSSTSMVAGRGSKVFSLILASVSTAARHPTGTLGMSLAVRGTGQTDALARDDEIGVADNITIHVVNVHVSVGGSQLTAGNVSQGISSTDSVHVSAHSLVAAAGGGGGTASRATTGSRSTRTGAAASGTRRRAGSATAGTAGTAAARSAAASLEQVLHLSDGSLVLLISIEKSLSDAKDLAPATTTTLLLGLLAHLLVVVLLLVAVSRRG